MLGSKISAAIYKPKISKLLLLSDSVKHRRGYNFEHGCYASQLWNKLGCSYQAVVFF